MDGRDGKLRERKAVMQQAYRKELVERIARAVSFDGVEEPLPGMVLST